MANYTMSDLTFPDGRAASRKDIMRLARQYADEDMAPDDNLCTPGCRYDKKCIECMAEDLLRIGEESSSGSSSYEDDSDEGEDEDEDGESESESGSESGSGSDGIGSSSEEESEEESSSGEEEESSGGEESGREDESEAERDANYIEKRRLKTLAVVRRAKRKAEGAEMDADDEMDADSEDGGGDARDLAAAPPAVKRLRVELEMLDAIQIEQRRTEPAIEPAMFRRLAAEVLFQFSRDTVYTGQALEALQQAAETYLVGLFERANLAAIHAGREVVAAPDIRLARRLAPDA